MEKPPLPAGQKAVGIDMGVRKRLTLSTGETSAPAETAGEAVAKQQQKVSRCQRGSHTRRKQGRQLARLRRRQHLRNRNAGHRLTPDLMQRFGLIAGENLDSSRSRRKGLTSTACTNRDWLKRGDFSDSTSRTRQRGPGGSSWKSPQHARRKTARGVGIGIIRVRLRSIPALPVISSSIVR